MQRKAEWRDRLKANRSTALWVLFLLILLLLLAYKSRNSWNKQNREQEPAAVVTAIASTADVPVYLTALGSVIPTYTVTVRVQINGILNKVYYNEGQEVKKGDLLAEIDASPYLAQLTQYQGQLERDQALLANAEIDLARYQRLWKQDSVAEQTLATQKSLVAQYKGAIQTDLGLIANVNVNIGYSKITSPIDGRVGLRLVDAGNLVQTSDTNGIVIINTLNPITVVFAIAQDFIPDVMAGYTADKGLTTEAYDRLQNVLLAKGNLLTVDNQINLTTGTVKLKAQFENPKGLLFPNQFVNIRLLVKTLNGVTIVPTEALQYSSTGAFIYVVQADNTVKYTQVKPGITSGKDTVINEGIRPEQVVVIEGVDKLKDGAKVSAHDRNSTIQKLAYHNKFFTTSAFATDIRVLA